MSARSTRHFPIRPHGGTLVDRTVPEDRAAAMAERARDLPTLALSDRQLSDLEMIATGAFSPLEGFMTRADYASVVESMRLANGLPWPISVVLDAEDAFARRIDLGDRVALGDADGAPLALLDVEDRYRHDREAEARAVYGTTDRRHPGVRALAQRGEWLLGGRVTAFARPTDRPFADYRLSPAETRARFREHGWERVVGFQTRNPIHRAHEYLHKCVLETYDGLLIHPVVGPTKDGDLPQDVRMRCYEAIIDGYYPRQRVLLATYPAAMRYAGPREAVLHALVRKNYGCTHFIVGRDHAGVGDFYDTYAAHRVFDEFEETELEITPLFFDHAFYCHRCEGIASIKTCPHGGEHHTALSGSHVRKLLESGEALPREFTRPEVAEVMMEWARSRRRAAGGVPTTSA